MKATELMQGNFTEQGQIKSFYENGVHIGYGKCLKFSELTPILLTEEWLLKFGGQIKPFSIGIILDRFRFIWKEEYKYWYVIAADPGGAYMTKIEFVHELQNFFQSTNGQELTLKP